LEGLRNNEGFLMSNHSDRLITNPAVARLFCVAPRTVFNWVTRPELGFPRPLIIGARRYFSEAEILAWKASHVLGAAPAATPSPNVPAIADPIPSRKPKASPIDRENASKITEAV
jgi:predicted DNA-binding transcriptional regulator AlpA